jgi:filamentous hemagglutinin family protein
MLVGLTALQPSIQAASALPAGGIFTAGSGKIMGSGNTLTVNQSSLRGIIDWNTFSIGKGGSVIFNNGSGATLNRVTGSIATSILGQLLASGTVYIINPQGVLIGRGATVHTGGDFLAGTLNLSNSAFLNSGALLFSGSSNATTVNLGNLTSAGGSVYLIGRSVRNSGSINTPNGTTGLAAGSRILIVDTTGDQHVYVQAPGGDVTNSGFINAAQAELKSNGGNIYALAGNNGGQIRATGTATKDGHVWLIANDGTANVAGTISAQNADGTGGTVETSGAQVRTSGATVATGRGGSWLLDPDDLTIDSGLASTIETSLNSGTNVTEQTSAPVGGGNGDITVASDVAWNSGAALTLSAYRNVAVNSGVTVSNTGAGNLTLRADNSSNGTGAVVINGLVDFSASTGNVAVLYDPPGTASTKYTAPVTYGVSQIKTNSGWTAPTDNSISSQSTAYMLVNGIADLQNVGTNRSGNYALGTDIDASSVANFAPIGTSSAFSGIFDGQGHTISNLTIDDTTDSYVGLFGNSSGKIRNVSLTNESVTGSALYLGGLVGYSSGKVSNSSVAGTLMQENTSNEDYFGGLLGWNSGTVNNSSANVAVGASNSGIDYYAGGLIGVNLGPAVNSYATGSVTLSSTASSNLVAGGLSGYNSNTITGSYASATVTVNSPATTSEITGGGLVGENDGTISNSYASSAVNGGSNVYVGGLAGYNYGDIASSYATGPVTAATANHGGGLIGNHGAGTITSSYWDSQSTSQSVASGNSASISGATGQTTTQLQSGTLPSGFSSTDWITTSGFYPFLTWQGKIIAGMVFNGTSPLASVTVDGLVNGISVGGVTTNASGYYSFFAPNSAFSAGSGVLTYLIGGNQGNTFSDGDGSGAYSGMNIYTGTLSLLNRTNNAYSGMLNALSITLGSNSGSNFLFTLNSGNLSLNSGANLSIGSNVALAIDQPINIPTSNLQIQSQAGVTQSQPIMAAGLSLSGNGNFALTNAGNGIGILAANLNGSLSLANAGPLTIGTVGNNAGISAGGTVLINTTGNLTIAPGSTVAGSGPGDAVVLANGGQFLNLEGSDALNVSSGGGRWLVYSQNPANDTRGALAYDFKQYDAFYGTSTPAQTTGNGFLYSYAPVLTVGLTGTIGKTYDGTAAATLTSGNYNVSGSVDGDTITLGSAPAVGTYSNPNAGSGKTVTANGISSANLSIGNGSASIYGYQLGSSVASGNIGTINPAILTYTADASSRSSGVANPVFTGTVTGFVNNETLVSATTGAAAFISPASASSAAGSYAINGSGLTANYGNYVFTQAASNATALAVIPASVIPPPPPPPPVAPPTAPTVLTLVVNNAARLQNQPNPIFTAAYNGPPISGLDIASIVASLKYQSVASSAPAGTYQIAASTAAVVPGYTIEVVPGALTVLNNSPQAIPTQVVSNNLLLPNLMPAAANFPGLFLQPANAGGIFQIGFSRTNGFVPFGGFQQSPLTQSSFFGDTNGTSVTYFAGAKP